MARHQSHRGPAAKDNKLFGSSQLAALRAATHDLCWLLDHGYAVRSAAELVGNRHKLLSRQRMAVNRCACSFESMKRRHQRQLPVTQLRGKELWLDGYNVLTLLESALAGGVVLLGRDGCCRDITGIHRCYRKVTETGPVLRMIGEVVAGWGVTCCRWWLDSPVSNSGRLKTFIQGSSAGCGWNMPVELVFNPDKVLGQSEQVIATSDGIVLDHCWQWVNLTREVVSSRIPQAWLVDLSPEEDERPTTL